MLRPPCPFCNHANPAGAKYCNDCGSPLHLKPCNRCEAINDEVASDCYKCGAEFPVITVPEAASVSRSLDTTAAYATPSDMGFERGHAPLAESVAKSYDVPLRRPGNQTVGARDHVVEVLAREPRPLGGGVTSLFAARRRPLPRLALAVALPAAVLTAVGVSAYYVYRDQLQLSGSLSAGPMNSAAQIGVTASPINQSNKGVIGPEGVNAQAPTPRQSDATVTSQPGISTGDQAAPAQQLVTEAVEVARAPGAETAVAAERRHKTTRAGGSRVASARSAADPSTSTYRAAAAAAPPQLLLNNSRLNVPPDAPRPSACSEAVAALGLCSPTSRTENK